MTVVERKWLRFEMETRGEKTNVWSVATRDAGTVLGYIRWFGRWRGYSFFPNGGTTFEPTCLRDIADFVAKLTQEHREARAACKAMGGR